MSLFLHRRQLLTLGVGHAAAALRTHGLGLADSALAAAHRLLSRHFEVLFQVRHPGLRAALRRVTISVKIVLSHHFDVLFQVRQQ